jgi:hypothetical protein
MNQLDHLTPMLIFKDLARVNNLLSLIPSLKITTDEIVAIVGHELGYWYYGHNLKVMFFVFVSLLN